MNLGSIGLGIRYSYKVKAVCHVSDSLLPLLIRQYKPSTSRLTLDWSMAFEMTKKHTKVTSSHYNTISN